MKKFCDSLNRYLRRTTGVVRIGSTAVGGDNPIRVQSMTNTDTNDTAASVAQVERIADAGAKSSGSPLRGAAKRKIWVQSARNSTVRGTPKFLW